jgi:hypothetical protein
VTYAYSDHGLSFRAAAQDYEVQAGEIVFPDIATSRQRSSSERHLRPMTRTSPPSHGHPAKPTRSRL